MSNPAANTYRYSFLGAPTLENFNQSNAFIRGLLGPFGSGKSSACVFEMVDRSLIQRRSPDGRRKTRWGVIRNTFPELRDTTIKTIFQWLPPQHFGRYYESKHSYVIKAFEGCDIELVFLALDRPEDIKKLLSLELTGGWINEGREVPWAIFEALQGRIGRYPAKVDNGPSWFGMWSDSNPPDSDSKWFKFFEEKAWLPDFKRLKHEGLLPSDMEEGDYVAYFKQPSGLSPHAENLPNLPGGRRYYANLMAGKSKEWVKIYVEGDYGFLVEGKLVYGDDYSDQVHCRAVDPVPGVTVVRSWDFGLCYSDDTEVLTNHGWKFFKDVDEKADLAASRDPATGRMQFAPIAFKVAKPFKGEMLEWASTEVNMLVTPEHIVPYTHRDHPGEVRWAPAQWLADNLGRHHMVDLTSRWEPDYEPAAWFGKMNDVQFAAFMGLFLSEGSATPKGGITIYQLKEKTKPQMRAVLAETGMEWREFTYSKGGRVVSAGWRAYDKVLGRWLSAMGDQRQRRVPWEVREMPPHALMAFIETYTLGDGHVRRRANGSEEHTLFSVSDRMAGDFQEIAQKVGWNCTLRWRRPQTSIITEGVTKRAIVNTGGWEIVFKKRAQRAELFRRNFRRVAYDGLVYCLNVPWHTLYVRRNGRAHWNGNTPACVFSQLLPTGQWLTFDEMTSDNMSVDQFGDAVVDHCARTFRGEVEFEDWGDPAGNNRAETDKRSAFEILRTKGINIDAARSQDPTLRQESVRRPLRSLVNGEPQFILHPRCRVLRKGFMGGYHRRKLRTGGPDRYTDKPEKNDYSHPHDALQYGMVQYFGEALTSGANPYADEDEFYGPHDDPDFVDPTRSEVTGY